jgi:hypothetical protein
VEVGRRAGVNDMHNRHIESFCRNSDQNRRRRAAPIPACMRRATTDPQATLNGRHA